MKRFENLIGLLVVLILLVLPMTAFAENVGVQDEAELRAQLEANQAVVISASIDLTGDLQIPAGTCVTLPADVCLYVPGEFTLTNNGKICLEGGALTVHGTFKSGKDSDITVVANSYEKAYYPYGIDSSCVHGLAEVTPDSEYGLQGWINIMGTRNYGSSTIVVSGGEQTLSGTLECYFVDMNLDICTRLIIPEGSSVLNYNTLTVRENGEIQLDGEIYNDGILTVNGPIKGSGMIDNDGEIRGNTSLVQVTVEGYEPGEVIGKPATDAQLRRQLAADENVEISTAIELTDDLSISPLSAVTLKKGGSLIVPEGCTLTNNGYIYLEGGTLTVNGSYIAKDKVNGGTIYLIMENYEGLYIPAGLKRSDLAALLTVNTVSGLQDQIVMMNGLKCGMIDLQDCGPQVLTGDLTIPAYVDLAIRTKLTVPAGVTVYNDGVLIIADGIESDGNQAELVLNGTLYNSGLLRIDAPFSGSGLIVNTGEIDADEEIEVRVENNTDIDTEEKLRNRLASTMENINITGNITLTSSLEIPRGKNVILPEGVTLTVPAGCTLINNGRLIIVGTLELGGKFLNYSTAILHGAITGSGMIVVDDGYFDTYSSDKYDASAVHEIIAWFDREEPTCSTDGQVGIYNCSCHNYHDENYDLINASDITIPATGEHVAGEGKEATCTTKAVCKYCGESFGELAPHDLTTVNTKDATCEEDGESVTTCSHCDYREENIIPALGHSKGDHHEATPPTCSVDGNKIEYYDCINNCGTKLDAEGKVLTEENIIIPALNHNPGTELPEEAATCTAPGTKVHYTCSRCNAKVNADGTEVADADLVIKALGHQYGDDNICTVCGQKKPEVKSVELSAKVYSYDGKVKTPTVTVKDTDGNALVEGEDYTVTYPTGRKNVGKYTVTVNGKGSYSFTKTLDFTIKPVKTAITKLTAGQKSFTAKWGKKTGQVTGYEIQYSLKKNMSGKKTVAVKKNTTVSKTFKNLKAGKTYYARIRTYKVVDGTKIYSDWSAIKKVRTQK